jgi:hypothetical protein
MEGSMCESHIMFVVKSVNKPRVNKKYECPECGAIYGRFYGERPACGTCDGLGMDPSDDPIGQWAMLVPVNDAILILNDLLNYGTQEKVYWKGTLEPTDVLVRLSLADYRIESMINPLPFYDCAVDKLVTKMPNEETLRFYVDKLIALAEKANEVDDEISYFTR